MKKSDFFFEEDFIIEQECDDCGELFDKLPQSGGFLDCPTCGGYLLNTTSHEGCDCELCGEFIDMWTDTYVHKKSRQLLCIECYEELTK